MKKAAVCIATCRRDEGLTTLLQELKRQEIPQGWELEVRVVSNDPQVDQRKFVRMVTEILPSAIVSFEHRQNIALARNATIRLGSADAYLFIDDDERPGATWVRSLLYRLNDPEIDAVIGPVLGNQNGRAPHWLEQSGAFDKLGPEHDGSINWCQTRTSSAAIRGDLLGRYGEMFDPEYGRSGGSDTELFKRLEEYGAKFVHERAAFVYEDNDPDRCCWRAVLRRRFKAGAVYGRMQLQGDTQAAAKYLVSRSAYGISLMLAGSIPLILGNPATTFRGACRVVSAIGAWRGRKPGYRVERYKPVDASVA
jgi:succinoglycan biosynthesis protein ExoM